ncbi:MAG: substrate-binding domain-containing protein [Spirochaetaceae bacterium]|jgi:D-xylose transport system substrate-binding protein|nr:substrate-binding domain-containing protein [Spirochaetaceae bacterium]
MKRAITVKKLIAVIASLVFLSCTAKQARTPGQASPAPSRAGAGEVPEKGRITIGFSVATDTFIVERWNKDVKVFSGAAQELGGDMIVQLSAGGIREQIAQINYMVNQNIDILVVIAHDTEMIAGAVKQVRDAGIPVIAYDRMIQGVPLDAYISFDSQEVGRQFGRALREEVPRGKYLIVNGGVHDVNSFDISRGLHEIIDPLIAAGMVHIEREIWLEEWSFDEALEKISGILEETTAFDAIACGNDSIAQAAIQLLSERRMAGNIVIVGQDAELISCQYIVEGLQLMTVYKPIGKLAARAAELAMAIAEKRTIPHDMLLDNGSGVPIPSYIEAPIAVFKDNMDVVIRDGFHSYEDVYRNVLF